MFPEIGNGGYNAIRYAINIRYDPATNTFLSGTSTAMTARATKDLSQLSLDFEGLTVTAVSVAGDPATFNRVAPAACSPSPPVVPPCAETKLIVNPAQPIADDELFTVRVSYLGTPSEHTDPDNSVEGWIRACSGADPATCDGAFVVNEPIGAMTWFPSNNYPTDKALFDTAVTVPSTHKAIGVGELESHGQQRQRDHDLDVDRGRPDRDLPDDGDGRPLRPDHDVDDRGHDLAVPARLHGDRQRLQPDPEGRGHGGAGGDAADPQLLQRSLRHLSVRLDRRGGRPHHRRRLRARGADEAPLPELHERAAADRSSTSSPTSGSATR